MELNWFKVTKGLLGYLLILCVEIIVIISFFIYHFNTQEISKNIADWASFGDFIGGVLNPLIAFFSLVLLGVITWLIAYKSDSQNLKMNLLQKRMEAFEILTNEISSLEKFHVNLYQFGCKFNSFQEYSDNLNDTTELIKLEAERFDLILQEVSKCKVHVEGMSFQYGHLFEYDFTQKQYSEIVHNIQELTRHCENITVFVKTIGIDIHSTEKLMNKIVDESQSFYNRRQDFLNIYMLFIGELKSDMNKLRTL